MDRRTPPRGSQQSQPVSARLARESQRITERVERAESEPHPGPARVGRDPRPVAAAGGRESVPGPSERGLRGGASAAAGAIPQPAARWDADDARPAWAQVSQSDRSAPAQAPVDVWRAAQASIREAIGERNHRQWIQPLSAQEAGGQLRLLAVDAATARAVERHFLDTLKRILADGGFRGELSIDDGDATPAPRRTGDRLSFEGFVVGEANEFAYGAARRVAAELGEAHNPLYLHGGVGLGKTHLATAIARDVAASGAGDGVRVVSAGAFLSAHGGGATAEAAEELDRELTGCRLLVLDDIQCLAGDAAAEEAFFYRLDLALEEGCQVVLTCDLPPPRIPSLAVGLRSRFENGFTAEIQSPDVDLRERIVEHKAAAVGLDLGSDVVSFIAQTEESSIRALQGALNRAREFATASHTELSLAVARRALAHLLAPPKPPALEAVIGAVAKEFGVGVRALTGGKKRDRATVSARQVAVHVTRELTGRPLRELADELGFRDHSAASHAASAVKKRMDSDLELGRRVARILSRFGH